MSVRKNLCSTRRIAAMILCLALAAALITPLTCFAEDNEKTVRVGWYESVFNKTDALGRRSGYAYDFQSKVAAYADWKYDYVEGTWPELLQMLKDGEIDILSDVSYTEERSGEMLFPSEPMGAEEYYIFISLNGSDYSHGSYSWFNGKRVGVNKGSVQLDIFNEWARDNGVTAEVVQLTCGEYEAQQKLVSGNIDALVTLDYVIDPDTYSGDDAILPAVRIGSSDFYFAVNKDRPDLLEDLNTAMTLIENEDRYYTQRLVEKYLNTSVATLFLTANEREWLADHGAIRVGYIENYLPFCGLDEHTGSLNGALKDYLDDAAHCFKNAELSFEPIAYASINSAKDALDRGEVDCVFPANFSVSDGESMGLLLTMHMMSTEVYALVRKSDKGTFNQKTHITTAVVRDDPNLSAVIKDHFADWKVSEYADLDSCLRAVANGKADCVVMSNYRYNSISRRCDRYGLLPVATDREVNYYFAVKSGSKELYSILSSSTNIVSRTTVSAALAYYSYETSKSSLIDMIMDNIVAVLSVTVVIIILVAVILIQHIRFKMKEHDENSRRQVEDLNKLVYVDALTSGLNKGAFNKSVREIQDKLDSGEKVSFAVGVFDCDDLKQINDNQGHDRGDLYIKAAYCLIVRSFPNSPVFRIGGDEFAVILQGEDYDHITELKEGFKRDSKISETAGDADEYTRLTMGMAVYDPSVDLSVNDTIRRADSLMYRHKYERKGSISASEDIE